MKEFLLLILMWFFLLVVQGQNISVKSFRILENDLDARTHYPKEDRNGEKAAIIKIVTTETGFEFEAGTIGVVAVVPKTSEIWVYVPRGSKMITIKHPRLGLLRNEPYPIAIEAGTVYEMVLVTGKVVVTVDPAVVESQWLVITSEPPGADVYINDKPSGKTPYQNELPVGKYAWRLSKELYLPEAGMAELLTGSSRKVVNVNLKPNFGALQIGSLPESGASVSLNGITTGKVTPCKMEMVPTGDHTITLSRDMYETTQQRVNLEAGETKNVSITMNPTFAELTLSSDPAGDIYINGEYKAKGNWKGRLNPGVYTFEARLDKHNTATEKQSVLIGQPLNLTLRPVPRTGNLKIITNPFDATVKIAGIDKGKTPVTLRNILIGEYQVELSLAGYATTYEKTTITEGQTSEINATLQSGMMVTINSTPQGADLFIDDRPVGKTPFNGNLTFGSHRLRIESNAKKAEKQVQVSQGGSTAFSLEIAAPTTETAMGLNLEMVFVKGGTYQMGSNDGNDDENPVHSVTVGDFYLGKYEVTQSQWKAVMGSNPSRFSGCDNCPVEQVSWNDVQEFIKKLNQKTGKNYRLPTEAEWEYAARGGNQSRGYTYSGSNSVSAVAWFTENSGSKTHKVGQKKANELGLYDMSGNVWEWCSDWYGSDYYKSSPADNPKGPSSGSDRVYRGGSWGHNARYCRSSYRFGNSYPGHRIINLGFRLVVDP